MSAFALRPYQAELVDRCNAAWERRVRAIVLQMGTGAGKCLGIGTPVLLFDGTIVPVEGVQIGDKLMGPDGRARSVLGTARGRGEMFRIMPLRGRAWTCNDVHVLTLVHSLSGEVVDVPLNEYLGWSPHRKHLFKQFAPENGVDFEPSGDLPVDPYFLGVWLGDGHKALRGVMVSKPDAEIEACVRNTAHDWGLSVRISRAPGKCPTYHVTRGSDRKKEHGLLLAMRELMRNGVCVPHVYLTSSRSNRRALLAGILDTDGYLHNGCFEVAQRNSAIADGIAFLARSLGYRVTEADKFVGGTRYARLSISGRLWELPIRIPRKQAAEGVRQKVATRTGFAVMSLGTGDYAGFELDGDGRFLLGDFTVTHNTATSAEILRRATALGYRAVFVAHLDALIDDTYERLARAGIRAGLVQAGRPADPTAPVQVCSTQTMHTRGERPPADLVILDECHRAAAQSVRAILSSYPHAALLGLTATPQRGDGRPLDMFEELIQGPNIQWLTDQGYLVPYDLLAPLGFHERGLVADPVEVYRQYTPNKRALVFAANVAHARWLARGFNDAGYPAECVVGTTSRPVRRSARERMRNGTLLVIVGVGVFIEGWDEPSVESIVFARRFSVLGPWIQANGRGLRPSPGKTRCTMLDPAGNVLALGLPDELVEWSLHGTAVRRMDGRLALRHCKECLAVFATQARCPRCGARVTAATTPRLPMVLKPAEKLENYARLPQSERDAQYLEGLRRIARIRVRLPESRIERWALQRFKQRFARLPAANDNGHSDKESAA